MDSSGVMTLAASVCAFLCVALATMVLVDFVIYVSARYKEKFLQQTAAELDDVVLQVPPGRILDVSLALSAFGGFMAITFSGVGSRNWSLEQGIVIGVVAAGICFPLPRLYLRFLKQHRLRKFNQQLENTIMSISASLKAGFSINQALNGVVAESPQPTAFEFQLLTNEVRLGVPLDEALEKMVARLESPDMELVATAIITARQTGGELTVVLARLAGLIRERMRINNKLMAMTSQGRMQAGLIGVAPLVLFFAMSAIAPGMMAAFYHSSLGILLLVAT
ncbi:MAG: type II secretion system F family protein, partial [Victivallales bacterium]|nr:type II secretion system F family protein [Victivallales bacterium]